jgi:signal transduction histidine kinase
MQTVVDALAEDFGYAVASIMLVDHSKQVLRPGAMSLDNKYLENFDFQQSCVPFSVGILGWVARNQRSYLCRDTDHDPYYRNEDTLPRVGSELGVPIFQLEKVEAVLLVSTFEPDKLDELDLEMMSELATELGLHMENVKLYAQTEQNALELERRVVERTSQLQAVNRELEAFAYSVSHDLRAPLRSIDGFSQALLEDYLAVLDTDAQTFLVRIRAASQRMGQLIDDLLTLSRVTRREFRVQDVNLSEIASDVCEILRGQDKTRIVECDIEADMIVNGDVRMLRIVLENLLSNAWKFTEKTEKAHLEFKSQKADDGTMIYVMRDNGVGFNMEYADKLFRPFQRLHGMNEFEGNGVGLATVNRVIQRHGGRIWAEAQEGHGATFFFTLGEYHADDMDETD